MTTSIRTTMLNQSTNKTIIKTNQKINTLIKLNLQMKKNTTGDNIVTKTDSLAAAAIPHETGDDVDREAKGAKAAPSTEAVQFFLLHPSAATSTRTPSVFDITAYAS